MIPRFLFLAPFLLAFAPVAAPADAGHRAGREIVATICSKCHEAGLNGAPKIGDRDAWIPRMKRGLPALSLSAIRGHGNMPPRGGHAELTDAEIGGAIVYMFDPGAEARAAARPPPPSAPARGTLTATVDGIEVHFGLVGAERLRSFPSGSSEARMHGGVPAGRGHYHVNVTLFDAASHAGLVGATVEVEVTQAGVATQRKDLETLAGQGAASYGQYVRLAPKVPPAFTVRIRPAASTHVAVARFTPMPE